MICMREGIYCSVYSRFKNLIYDKFTFSVFVTVVAVMAVLLIFVSIFLLSILSRPLTVCSKLTVGTLEQVMNKVTYC